MCPQVGVWLHQHVDTLCQAAAFGPTLVDQSEDVQSQLWIDRRYHNGTSCNRQMTVSYNGLRTSPQSPRLDLRLAQLMDVRFALNPTFCRFECPGTCTTAHSQFIMLCNPETTHKPVSVGSFVPILSILLPSPPTAVKVRPIDSAKNPQT